MKWVNAQAFRAQTREGEGNGSHKENPTRRVIGGDGWQRAFPGSFGRLAGWLAHSLNRRDKVLVWLFGDWEGDGGERLGRLKLGRQTN
jgi:hypothetical protein